MVCCCQCAGLPAAGVATLFRLRSPRATRAWLEELLPDGERSSDSSCGRPQLRYLSLRADAGRPSFAVLIP